MPYIDIQPMREPLKPRLLTGIKQSGTYRYPDAIRSVDAQIKGEARRTAELFLNWNVANKVREYRWIVGHKCGLVVSGT